MCDPEIYGPKVYEYPFSQGVEDGNVVDYDLWAPVITPGELSRIGVERGITEEEELKELLAEIAISKVMEETGQTRFLTYHRQIKHSRAFAGRLRERYESQGFAIGHIDGSTPQAERMRLLDALANGKAIVTNCKAFVEGVDAPGLQGIAFVDSKGSVVDIVQAIGRPTRVDPNDENKRASIVVPIVYDPDDRRSPQEQAKDQGFGTLIKVVQALSANDDTMADSIRENSRQAGRTGSFEIPKATTHNMKLLGLGESLSQDDLSKIGSTISIVSLTATRDKFAQSVGMLEAHLEENYELPTTKSNSKLYSWMRNTRLKHRDGRLDEKQAAMLDKIRGWSWIGDRDKPEAIAAHLKSFYERKRRIPDIMSPFDAENELGSELDRSETIALYGETYYAPWNRGKKTKQSMSQ